MPGPLLHSRDLFIALGLGLVMRLFFLRMTVSTGTGLPPLPYLLVLYLHASLRIYKDLSELCLLLVCATFSTAMEYREHARYEKQSCNCGKQQPPNYGTSQWRVLLATLAEPERHGHHSNDHGQ